MQPLTTNQQTSSGWSCRYQQQENNNQMETTTNEEEDPIRRRPIPNEEEAATKRLEWDLRWSTREVRPAVEVERDPTAELDEWRESAAELDDRRENSCWARPEVDGWSNVMKKNFRAGLFFLIVYQRVTDGGEYEIHLLGWVSF